MVLKIITRKQDGMVLDLWVIKIAHIDCPKDTYEVLKKTIRNDINAGIKELQKEGTKIYFFQSTTDFFFDIGDNIQERIMQGINF